MKGWKTITFNVANAVVLAATATTDVVTIPQEFMSYWIALLFTGNFLLRLVTTTPVGRED